MTNLTRRNIIRAAPAVGVVGLVGAGEAIGPARAVAAGASGAPGTVRPEDYGAVADGQTDCTQAFRSAIAVLASNGPVAGRYRRRALVLSVGAYRLTDTITIPGNDVIVTGQNTTLLIDHTAGDGVVFSGGGDIVLRGVSIEGTPLRQNGTSGNGLVFLPYAGQKFCFRVTVADCGVANQPGNGIVLNAPEALRMENVGASHNGGHGCLIDGSKFENLDDSIEFVRFSNNGGCGLNVINISNSRFSRVECLNNKGVAQFSLSGHYNRVEMVDCECFEFAVPGQSIGLMVSGHGNLIEGGTFYKLNTAIMLKGANDNRLRLAKFEGDPVHHMTGVMVGPDCARNVIDMIPGNFLAALVTDQGQGNVILRNGRDPAVVPLQHAALAMPLSGQIVPNLVEGSVLSLVTDGAVHVLAPAGGKPGDLFTLIVDTQHRGIGTVNFADSYRGVPAVVAANPASRYLTACFVMAPNGHCLPQSLMAYD